MKKSFIILVLALVLLTAAALPAYADGGREVVFLKNGGTGDGSSADNALGTMAEAYAALDLSRDGTIVICGDYTQEGTFEHTAEYTGSVTLTSVWDGVDYRKTAGAMFIVPGGRYVCTGAFTVRNLDYHMLDRYYLVIAQHHPVLIDTGVKIESENFEFSGMTFGTAFGILGGYQNGQPVTLDGQMPPAESDRDISVTVRSGSNILIGAVSRQIAEPRYSGTATVTVEGDAEVGVLYYAPLNVPFDCDVKVVLNVGGNARIGNIYGGTSKGTIGSLTLNWLSGEIGGFDYSNRIGEEAEAKNGYKLFYTDEVETDPAFATMMLAFQETTKVASPERPPEETKPAETQAPETKAQETNAPETKAPETKAPGTKAPETKATEPAGTVPATQPAQQSGSGSVPAYVWAIVGVAVIAAAAVIGLVLKKKKK